MLRYIMLISLITRMYCNSEGWRYDVLYYQSQNLTCETSPTHRAHLTGPGHTILWLLPSGQILNPGDDHERVDIAADGRWLNVKRVNDVDFGVYNCLVFTNGALTLNVQKGINVNGAFWGDLMKKYAPNAVVGAVSAAVTFAMASLLCFCYGRHQERGQQKYEAYQGMLLDRAGRQNDGFQTDAVSENTVPEKGGIELPMIVTKF